MVFVLDKNKKALSPTTNARARELLAHGKAVVHKVYPFIIRLKESKSCNQTYSIKLDPGANVTGGAIVDEEKAFFFFEILHRGKQIKKALLQRSGVRRARRNRNTRYRKPRFQNRRRVPNWLAPSVKSRADNIISITNKLARYTPINRVVIERVSFDVSQMASDVKLQGVDYQNGVLKDNKLRSFVLSKYNNTCAYCNGESHDTRLEIDHMNPKSNGGSNSTQNLILSCRTCNEQKGKLSLKEFGKLVEKDFSKLEPRKLPKDASIIQSARNYTINELVKNFGVQTAEGWETSLNRVQVNLPKEHYYDALCVGSEYNYKIITDTVLILKATGRGSRQMCLMDKYGFPRTSPKAKTKSIKGFTTGDMVSANVLSGKKQGKYFGRVATRSSGSFNISTSNGLIQGVASKYCKIIQKGDGYDYQTKKTA